MSFTELNVLINVILVTSTLKKILHVASFANPAKHNVHHSENSDVNIMENSLLGYQL